MTSDERRETIREIVAEHGRLPVDVAAIGDDDDLYEAGMTSHASVNVMIALEDALDVEFPQAALRRATFQSIASMGETLDVLLSEEPAEMGVSSGASATA